MTQSTLTIRIDEELKKNMEDVCQELGINMTTAITIFAKKVTREKRIPFEISIDPFYSEANMQRLEKKAREMDEGKYIVRELIEVED